VGGGLFQHDCFSIRWTEAKGSPLDNLAGANVTDLRGFVLVKKRCCAGTPNPISGRLPLP
jgi:hypothetical protein